MLAGDSLLSDETDGASECTRQPQYLRTRSWSGSKLRRFMMFPTNELEEVYRRKTSKAGDLSCCGTRAYQLGKAL